ncbi:DUF4179 domain-containing protein [Acinetobacter shaoyimingii]|uniref:DUF4179 domain-containing protein n=1 Tax=Acinetobacter shaoyimingii TaxID=2715164 RepID=A0A6G8RSM7_9GAMM|nr:DUF4179 domain-containing protein [Acinetobacter shaoyimingii]NHB56775.1 DUF4179 domain-containing protein [Acinetobacter shaoyimingii]QIO04723.1 DUF4179 domain-containing protein [Acinetobacter shaoyimingii]
MKKAHNYLLLTISIAFGAVTQTTSAAAIQKSIKSVQPMMISEKQSPIVKALSQQKRERQDNRLPTTDVDQLKMITSINNAPSQNFLAEQHQRFSRFVQALFQPHNS